MFNEGRCVFVAGGTGYMGQKLIAKLLLRGHEVRALVRPGRRRSFPPDASRLLEMRSMARAMRIRFLRQTRSCSWWE